MRALTHDEGVEGLGSRLALSSSFVGYMTWQVDVTVHDYSSALRRKVLQDPKILQGPALHASPLHARLADRFTAQ